MRKGEEQNPEEKPLFGSIKKHNFKGSRTMVNKVFINDFFQEQTITLSPTVINKSIRSCPRKSTEKQEFINNLSINKLRNINVNHRRLLQQNRISPRSSTTKKRKTYGHMEEIYKELQRSSFNTSVKEEIARLKRKHVSRQTSLPFQKLRQQKQSFKKESMSVGLKNMKQGLFLKTAPSFEIDEKGYCHEQRKYKDWSVYILRRKKLSIEPKPLRLQETDIKINTTFKFSLRSKTKPQNSSKQPDPVCGWNSDRQDDF